MSNQEKSSRRPPAGRAVGDEDPGRSITDGLSMPTGPAQPYDVEKLDDVRETSPAPRKPLKP